MQLSKIQDIKKKALKKYTNKKVNKKKNNNKILSIFLQMNLFMNKCKIRMKEMFRYKVPAQYVY